MAFGERIKGLRKTLGLTQVQLSALVGITQGSLSAIEKGNTKELKAQTILALAKNLGTSPEWLKTGKGLPTEPEQPTPDEAEALHLFRASPTPGARNGCATGAFFWPNRPPKRPRQILSRPSTADFFCPALLTRRYCWGHTRIVLMLVKS